MSKLLNPLSMDKFVLLILIFLVIVDISVFFNIYPYRQIFGFIFLFILPGLLILQIIKLNEVTFVEKYVLSIGLSISFLMFFGLLVNNVYLFLGYGEPLKTNELLSLYTLACILLVSLGYKMNKESAFYFRNINLTINEKKFVFFPLIFPALSAIGTYLMNSRNNNITLMILLFLISFYLCLICLSYSKFSPRLFPVVIYSISISLLLMISLRSNNILGIDTHKEYSFFQTTLNCFYWDVFEYSSLNSCLSVSLLPVIYKSILDIDPIFLFKVLYSLIFSISPLIIYIISKKYVGELNGFLASFYFMSLHNFLLTPMQARTNTALLFVALGIMVLFNENIPILKKRILFIVFMTSCIVSHYSTTYLFFILMTGYFIGMKLNSSKCNTNNPLSPLIAILFFVSIFFWYSQITGSSFTQGIRFVENTLTSLNYFFLDEMRSSSSLTVFGVGVSEKGIPHKIEFLSTWMTFILIGTGLITSMIHHTKLSFLSGYFKSIDRSKYYFETGYYIFAIECILLYLVALLIPYISIGYSLNRVYIIGSIVLSVFFVVGGIFISNCFKIKPYFMLLFILLPYFLCTTGTLYQIFEYPQKITLSSEGNSYETLYVHDQDSFGSKWLGEKREQNSIICTDHFGLYHLVSQGKINVKFINEEYLRNNENISESTRLNDGYIYLRYSNTVGNKIMWSSRFYNTSEISDFLNSGNKIYNNDIYIYELRSM